MKNKTKQNYYFRSFFVIGVFLFSLLFLYCTNHPVTHEDNEKPKRNFSWSIDTLKYPGSYQTLMRNIWGASHDDIYIVGHNSSGFGKMYHYNGENWEAVKLTQGQGGPILGPIDLNYIFGLDSQHIWATGERYFWNPLEGGTYTDSCMIVFFDGITWIDQPVHGSRSISSLWAHDPQNAWATSYDGLIYYYNGISWEKSTEFEDVQFASIYGSSPTNIFAIGSKFDTMPYDSVLNYVFYYNGNVWSKIDSLYEHIPPYTRNSIWLLNDNDVYIAGWGVFKKNNGGWSRIFNEDAWISKVRGTANNNLFAVGAESRIFHYNGNDWYRYDQFTSPYAITGVWADGNEVIALGNDGFVSYVFHGK
ncbi:MAG: hypothetical protein KKF62_13550 [Bacteroidetes bacterium]|nr:hypothetical protein [Bacteroidota bacterium]MBU1116228.1 hypothetical protein [Bacteroidota bacterium]MBU1799736.1 hypothetical protein [Bacteroidota bacterium]